MGQRYLKKMTQLQFKKLPKLAGESQIIDNLSSLPDEVLTLIAQFGTNGEANCLVTTLRSINTILNNDPIFSVQRSNFINENFIRKNFKPVVKQLAYGTLIPAYMFEGCQVLEGHGDYLCSVIQLTDGRLASGSADNTIRVWDLTKQADDVGYCRVLEEHGDAVWSVFQLTDGRLASGSSDKKIRIWDLTKKSDDVGYCQVLEEHGADIWSLIQLTDGRLASGSSDKTIRIWGNVI